MTWVRDWPLASGDFNFIVDLPDLSSRAAGGRGLWPENWRRLLAEQEGAVSRAQALRQGITDHGLRAHIAAGRWQRPLAGVYVVFAGPMPPATRYWVALLHVGEGAVLSHVTAGQLWEVLPPGPVSPVHVSVPAGQGSRSRRGIIVHRSRVPLRYTGSPPRTTLPQTVLTLCDRAPRLSDAVAILGRAAQRYQAEVPAICAALAGYRTLRRRTDLLSAVADVAGGAHSVFELTYLRTVERPHGLPVGRRQRRVAGTDQDVYYDEFTTTVELDGVLGHRGLDGRWRDLARDNASAARGDMTLRYGWQDVREQPCRVAAQVGAVLSARGWPGRLRRCGPGCRLIGPA